MKRFITTILTIVLFFSMNTVYAEDYLIEDDSLEPISFYSVLGDDNSIEIPESHVLDIPYSAIVAIQMKYEGCDCVHTGTGFMISNKCIVTAAHNFCCFGTKSKNIEHPVTYAKQMKIHVGCYGDSDGKSRAKIVRTVTPQTAEKWYYNANYPTSKQITDDYGYIKLSTSDAAIVGAYTSKYFTLTTVSDNELKNNNGKSIKVTGYLDYRLKTCDGNAQYNYQNDNIINHTADTSGGQSGSPIYYYNSTTNEYMVIGIHTNGTEDTSESARNSGCRITDGIKGILEQGK